MLAPTPTQSSGEVTRSRWLLFDGLNTVLLLLVVVCFFMPFFSISCGPIRANFSGMSLALGTDPTIEAPAANDEQQALREFRKESQRVPADYALLAIPCAGILGLVVSWRAFTRGPSRGIVVAPAVALLVFVAYALSGFSLERAIAQEASRSGGLTISAQRATWFYIGLWGSGLALLLACARRFSPTLRFETPAPPGGGSLGSPASASANETLAAQAPESSDAPPGTRCSEPVESSLPTPPAPQTTASAKPSASSAGTTLSARVLLLGGAGVVVLGLLLWLVLFEHGLPEYYGHYAIDSGRMQDIRKAEYNLALSPQAQFIIYGRDRVPDTPLVKLELDLEKVRSIIRVPYGWNERSSEEIVKAVREWNDWNTPEVACNLKMVRNHPDMTRVIPVAPLQPGIYLLHGSGYYFTVQLEAYQSALLAEARGALDRGAFDVALVSAAKAVGAKCGSTAEDLMRKALAESHALSARNALSRHEWDKVAQEAGLAFTWGQNPEMKTLREDVPFLQLAYEAKSRAQQEQWEGACLAARKALTLHPGDSELLELLKRSPRTSLEGHDSSEVRAVYFSSDNRTLLSATYGTMILWDVDTLKPLKTLNNPFRDTRFAVTPDARKIAAASNGLQVCDLDSQQIATVFKDAWSNIPAWGLRPDGKQLFAAGRWNRKAIPLAEFQTRGDNDSSQLDGIATFDLGAQRLVRFVSLPAGELPAYMTGSPTGNTIGLVYADGHILQYDPDMNTTTPLLGAQGSDWRFHFASDSILLGLKFREGVIRLYDLAKGREPVSTLTTTSGIQSIAWTSELLAIATSDSVVGVYELGSGRRLQVIKEPVSDLALSPDGRWLACGGNSGRLSLWKLHPAPTPASRPAQISVAEIKKRSDELLAAGKLEEAYATVVKAFRSSPDDKDLAGLSETTRKALLERTTKSARAAAEAHEWQNAAREARRVLRYEQNAEMAGLLEKLPYLQAAYDAETAAREEDWDRVREMTNQALAIRPADSRMRQLLEMIPRQQFGLERGGQMRMLSFALDGRTFLCGTEGSIVTWDLTTMKVASNYQNPFGNTRVAIARTGRRVAGLTGGLAVMDYTTDKVTTYTSGNWAKPTGWSFTRDGRYMWIAGVFDLRTLMNHGIAATALAGSQNGRSIVGMIQIDLNDSSNVTRALKFKQSLRGTAPIHLGRSPEGMRMCQLYEDGYVAAFDPSTGDRLAQHSPSLAHAVPVFRDETSFLLVQWGGTKIATWDTEKADSETTLLSTEARIRAASCSAGKLAVATEDGKVTIYDSTTGAEIQSFHEPEKLLNVELSNDGKLLACGAAQGKVIFWRIKARSTPVPSTAPASQPASSNTSRGSGAETSSSSNGG